MKTITAVLAVLCIAHAAPRAFAQSEIAPVKIIREIPLSKFASTKGLKPGARIDVSLAGGQTFSGTIVSMDKKSIKVEALTSRPIRKIPLSVFKGAQGLKPGVKVTLDTAGGGSVTATIIAVDKAKKEITTEDDPR